MAPVPMLTAPRRLRYGSCGGAMHAGQRSHRSVWSNAPQRLRLSVPGATEGEGTTATEGGAKESATMQKTLADLDALLGIEPEEEKEKKEKKDGKSEGGPVVSISEQALKAMTSADAARFGGGAGAEPKSEAQTKISQQMGRILERARKLAEEQSKQQGGSVSEADQQSLKSDFEQLLQTLSKRDMGMSKEDIKRLKDAAFGPQTFWVTETIPLIEPDRSGLLIRGNLRAERDKVFARLCEKVAELFKGEYEVIMVEDAEVEALSMSGGGASFDGGDRNGAASTLGPRVAFQIVPAAQATPPPTEGWQVAVALLLAVGFVFACGQLSLVANITKLPPETLAYFQNPPADAAADLLPPGLDSWDPTPYFLTAAPIFTATLTSNLMHEVGHRAAAYIRQVKLGPSFFIPNLSIGSFGAVTQFKSLVKSRSDLWDVAAAGPLAGGLVSLALMYLGLTHSDPAVVPKELLVPVPAQLLQGSLLLGSVTRLVMGPEALRGAEVLISPLTVAGWCGMLTTALNVLPVGSLDGGRMMQAAYGRQALALSSFFTYVGLGLGFLGSSLALPFGLYVLVTQRTAERFIQDNVSPAGDSRQVATAAAILAAILILLPMAPEIADAFGMPVSSGASANFMR